MRYILIAIVATVLAGCATTPQYDWVAMEQARQARLDTIAAQCEGDLCLVMVAQEQSRSAIRPPAQQHHPVWSILDRTLAIAVPAYFGSRQIADLAGLTGEVAGVIAGMDRADSSITVGGNFGNTDNSQTIGGNLGNTDNSISIGGNQGDTRGDELVAGNNIGDTRGDEWTVGGDNRFSSPGPIDESDNSTGPVDNSTGPVDNSTTNPPPP
jgi:hypothetical protein